tara:strand:+ start:21 stop:311 length:291 start_codon:yes stop_codon:yes gene_type:complete
MIIRKCAQDFDVVIHLNNRKGMIKKVALADGTFASITYPNSKKFFLLVDGEIVKKSDSFKTIEEEYVKEVKKKTPLGQGRIDLVKHKLIDNKVTLR